jgi:hypothetical protein
MSLTSLRSTGSRTMRSTFHSSNKFYHYGESWRRSGNTYPKRTITVHQGSITQTRKHHYGAEPSFHRSASVCKPALVLVRAYNTPHTRLKPPYRAFNDHRKGIDPIYSRSLLDYLCRCLLCMDTPVTDLINFALASPSLPPTKRTEIDYLSN